MVAALSSHHHTFFRKPSLYHLNKPLRSKRITSSLEFNITFAPPKPEFQIHRQPPKRPRFPLSPSMPALHSPDNPRRRWKPQAPFSPSGAFPPRSHRCENTTKEKDRGGEEGEWWKCEDQAGSGALAF
ncbi:hypothetical protein POPTR_010G226801v4 [Populus trichocarpa]|uniref:Uncharacterized protein n=1 Tax=Populus trichocarpa TaxID=3694 RepID=A0ACC0SF49_POPTR|nr:hypothetical protein POPTR_010G226801v4 [Populus trichocarpa]